MKVVFKCTACGSTDIRRDADAAWDVETQAWVLVAVYDHATCEKCGGQCSLESEPIAS